MGFIILILIALILVILYVVSYNRIISLKNTAEQAFSDIDNQLQRRNDLIPNLVNTVKGYAKHESQTLETVTQLRTQIINTNDQNEKYQLSEQMFRKMNSVINAVAESYPDLKASQNFSELQEELTDTENRIVYQRNLYNSTVANYNTKIQTFPSNIVAKIQKFTKMEFLKTDEAAKAVPKVEF